MQPIAIRYRDADGEHSDAPAYVGETELRRLVLARDRRARARRRAARRCRRCPRARAHRRELSRARPRTLSERLWRHRRAARHLIHAAIVEPDRGQRAAPQAARVEHQQVRRELQLERRPVAADDRRRRPTRGARARTTGGSRPAPCRGPRFSLNSIVPSARAEAQPRARVDDDAQPVEAVEVVAPRARLVAVERARGTRRRRSLASIASTSRESISAVAGVHCGSRPAWTSSRSPSTTTSGRRCSQSSSSSRSGASRIGAIVSLPMRLRVPGGDGQQMEVVVAENGDRRVAERLHLAQHGERIRAAVDEIADEPQPVARAARSRSSSSSWQNSAWQPWMSPIA